MSPTHAKECMNINVQVWLRVQKAPKQTPSGEARSTAESCALQKQVAQQADKVQGDISTFG